MSAFSILRPFSRRPSSLRNLVVEWVERRSTRAALAQLDDHLLRDIGLTLGQAIAEAEKPCWHE